MKVQVNYKIHYMMKFHVHQELNLYVNEKANILIKINLFVYKLSTYHFHYMVL